MDDYLNSITDRKIYMQLKKEDIQLLEHVLSKEVEELKRLRKLKEENKLDFGKTPSWEEAYNLLGQVKNEVESFLGITRLQEPIICYPYTTNQYCDKAKIVYLENEERTLLIPALGHEYTHHIQTMIYPKIMREYDYRYMAFCEGHARSMQRYIAERYRQKEDNEAFLYDITEMTTGEMKSLYKRVCLKKWAMPNKGLIKIKTRMDRLEIASKILDFGRPSEYAAGNTYFLVQETKNGKGVHKDMIKKLQEAQEAKNI
ncbi:MAG: hypothetical protein Q8N77_05670 [Nanoarchaeota archaeon]|nr:hypothetical protein [Nanoarchaeota archaeon]